MLWALDTTDGQLVTLRSSPRFAGQSLVRKRTDLIESLKSVSGGVEKIRDVLNADIVCPECGNPVFVYGLKNIFGFGRAGESLTRRNRIRDLGFSHFMPKSERNIFGPASVKSCSLYAPFDRRFIDRAKAYPKDPDQEEKVKNVVLNKAITRINRPVLAHLHSVLTGRSMNEEDHKKYIGLYENWFSSYAPLTKHPYLLPYLVMLAAEDQWNIRDGISKHARFVEHGAMELVFKNSAGEDRIVSVPQALRLQTRPVGGYRWSYDRGVSPFYITEQASFDLANILQFGKAKTQTIVLPSDTAAGQVALLSDASPKPEKPKKIPHKRIKAIQLSFDGK